MAKLKKWNNYDSYPVTGEEDDGVFISSTIDAPAGWFAIERDDEVGAFPGDVEAAGSLSPLVLGYLPGIELFVSIESELWKNYPSPVGVVVPDPRRFKTTGDAEHAAHDHNWKSVNEWSAGTAKQVAGCVQW